jgi:hypothetical protein
LTDSRQVRVPPMPGSAAEPSHRWTLLTAWEAAACMRVSLSTLYRYGGRWPVGACLHSGRPSPLSRGDPESDPGRAPKPPEGVSA